MRFREQLREKFLNIIRGHVGPVEDEILTGMLLEAVADVYAAPINIVIKPDDEQLEILRKSFQDTRNTTFNYFAYGCTCGATQNNIDKSHNADNKALWMLGEIP